jgi:haloacid dehalogenase-like hydrolase
LGHGQYRADAGVRERVGRPAIRSSHWGHDPGRCYTYRETRTIPIVFVLVDDPVGELFIKSVSRLGGNITGFIADEAARLTSGAISVSNSSCLPPIDASTGTRHLWPASATTIPCSNGNIALMADIARRKGMRFDAILGADVARDYKPQARVYQAAAEAFDLKPSKCMMVSAAAHDGDTAGAAKAGLRTATISRPDEFGPGKSSPTPKVPHDILAKDLNDLADKLGA